MQKKNDNEIEGCRKGRCLKIGFFNTTFTVPHLFISPLFFYIISLLLFWSGIIRECAFFSLEPESRPPIRMGFFYSSDPRTPSAWKKALADVIKPIWRSSSHTAVSHSRRYRVAIFYLKKLHFPAQFETYFVLFAWKFTIRYKNVLLQTMPISCE